MNEQRWVAIDELFHAALAVAPSERTRVLKERAGTDVGLRAEVESLLSAHDRSSSLLDSPAFDLAGGVSAKKPAIAPGQRIGKYTLRGVIGHGGSGIVYEAEQDEPSRIVALKVLRAAAFADEWTPRLFRREALALARLQHPGIAAVYEAGLGEEGAYFFAMERVEGLSITAFVGARDLSIRRRLELFQAVCDAVHHAHQHGVIHRDLKPANILVTPSGQPKVLDFGLARIADPDGHHTRITELGVFQGTLAYASPEQIRSAQPGDVDLRSDVYSLGIVLFEMLTGARPYETQGLTLPEAARVICEEPPRSLAAASPALRGDLATIVHKAIEKDPERRYTSAAALGDDVARYLAREPILAHPPSTSYQLRKLVARHRLPFAIAAAAFVLLIGLSVWLAVMYVRARDSERLAEQRAATSDRVKDFMLEVFASQDPDVAQGQLLSATELLRRGAQRIEADLADEPRIQAELLHRIGEVHQRRDEFAESLTLFQRALEIRIREFGESSEEVAHTRLQLGWSLKSLSRFGEAQAQYEAALSTLEAALGSGHESGADALSGALIYLAEVLRDQDPNRAEELSRRAWELHREWFGDDHLDTAKSLMNLGIVLRNRGDDAGAEKCYREALPVMLAHGEERAVVANLYTNLATALSKLGRLDEAEEAFLKAQRIYNKLYDGRHTLLAVNYFMLAALQRDRGRFREAQSNNEKALKMYRELLGDVNVEVASRLSTLASLRSYYQDDTASALPLQREALAIFRTLYPPDHQRLGAACADLAGYLSLLGQHEEAVALMREYVCICQAGPGGRLTLAEAMRVGKVLVRAGQWAEAEPLLRFGCDVLTPWLSKVGPRFHWDINNETYLGQCLAAQGRWEEAEQWLLSANARFMAEKHVSQKHSPTGIHAIEFGGLRAREALAALYEEMGRHDDAEAWRVLAEETRDMLAAIREERPIVWP